MSLPTLGIFFLIFDTVLYHGLNEVIHEVEHIFEDLFCFLFGFLLLLLFLHLPLPFPFPSFLSFSTIFLFFICEVHKSFSGCSIY